MVTIGVSNRTCPAGHGRMVLREDYWQDEDNMKLVYKIIETVCPICHRQPTRNGHLSDEEAKLRNRKAIEAQYYETLTIPFTVYWHCQEITLDPFVCIHARTLEVILSQWVSDRMVKETKKNKWHISATYGVDELIFDLCGQRASRRKTKTRQMVGLALARELALRDIPVLNVKGWVDWFSLHLDDIVALAGRIQAVRPTMPASSAIGPFPLEEGRSEPALNLPKGSDRCPA